MILKRDSFILFGIIFYIFAASTFYDGTMLIQASRLLLVAIYAVIIFADRSMKLSNYSLWLIVFAAYSVFSCAYASNTSIAVSGASTSIINAITIISFVGLCFEIRDHDIRLILMKCLAIIPLVLGVYIFGKYGIFCFANSRYLVEEHFFNSNTLGMHSAIGAIIGFWFLTQKQCKQNHRWFYYASTAANTLFVIFTASRKSIIIIVLAMIFYYLFQSKTPLKFIGKTVVIGVAIVLIWLALTNISFFYNLGGQRIEQMLNGFMEEDQGDGSTTFRLELIQWGLDWFKQKPIFGYGADNYRVLVGRMNTWAGTSGTYAHNNYIEIMVDLGLVGLVLYYSMYVIILKKFFSSIRHKDMQKLIIGCVFLSLIISEFGLVSYADKYYQIVYAIVWFIMIGPNKGVVTVDKTTISQRNSAVV